MTLYSLLSYMKRKSQGKDGYVAMKIDISKAYDRLEWHFLKATMCKMLGSGSHTRSGKIKILTLRTPTKIQVVQIKSIESRILPRRVLRQDCRKEERRFTPVTPYLELFVFFFRITDATIKHRLLLVSTRTDHPKTMLVC